MGAAIVVGAVVATLWVWGLTYRHPRTDDAAVRANVVGIASAVSGPIVDLRVVDNQPVHEGDLLFLIDERPYVARVEANRAALSLAEADLAAQHDAIGAAASALAAGAAKRRTQPTICAASRRSAGGASSRSTRSRRLARVCARRLQAASRRRRNGRGPRSCWPRSTT